LPSDLVNEYGNSDKKDRPPKHGVYFPQIQRATTSDHPGRTDKTDN
jgi:hypothetical protein